MASYITVTRKETTTTDTLKYVDISPGDLHFDASRTIPISNFMLDNWNVCEDHAAYMLVAVPLFLEWCKDPDVEPVYETTVDDFERWRRESKSDKAAAYTKLLEKRYLQLLRLLHFHRSDNDDIDGEAPSPPQLYTIERHPPLVSVKEEEAPKLQKRAYGKYDKLE